MKEDKNTAGVAQYEYGANQEVNINIWGTAKNFVFYYSAKFMNIQLR
jgi:hypothetical protein